MSCQCMVTAVADSFRQLIARSCSVGSSTARARFTASQTALLHLSERCLTGQAQHTAAETQHNTVLSAPLSAQSS